jgi:hypothetical protein
MPYYSTNKILLVHIPKTGGTSVEKYFSKKFNLPNTPSQLYFSYYDNTIQDEITKYRKAWKRQLYIKKKHEGNTSRSFQRVSSFTSVSSLEDTSREDIPEFKIFKKVRLSKELHHSLQHLTWSEMREHKDILWDDTNDHVIISDNPYDRNEYEIMTIVRNPYDRIISELLFRNMLTMNTINSPKIVYTKLKKYLENHDEVFDNHKLPQYLFLINDMGNIIENVTILHTETLTEDMERMGYIDFNRFDQVSKCRTISGITKYSNYLNREAVELINAYYKRDFELFGYSFL